MLAHFLVGLGPAANNQTGHQAVSPSNPAVNCIVGILMQTAN